MTTDNAEEAGFRLDATAAPSVKMRRNLQICLPRLSRHQFVYKVEERQHIVAEVCFILIERVLHLKEPIQRPHGVAHVMTWVLLLISAVNHGPQRIQLCTVGHQRVIELTAHFRAPRIWLPAQSDY